MINYLPDTIGSAKCLLFADDLKLLLGVGSMAGSAAFQSDINAAAEWGVANRLHLNKAKCKVITFSRKRMPLLTDYGLGDACLEREEEITDLGLVLDKKLDYRKHVSNICKRASKTLGFVMRASMQFHVGVAVVLYSAYVRSRFPTRINTLCWRREYNASSPASCTANPTGITHTCTLHCLSPGWLG